MARRRPAAPASRRPAAPSPVASSGRSSARASAAEPKRPARRAGVDRPAGRRRPPGSNGPTVYEQVRVPRLVTPRALVLGVVVLLAFALVYPTAQSYLAQRAKLNAAERDLAAAQDRRAELDNELQRWSDPAYVTSQARSRLSFVLPGERAFRVVDPDTAVEEPDPSVGPVNDFSGSDRSWYADVWTSVKAADGAG